MLIFFMNMIKTGPSGQLVDHSETDWCAQIEAEVPDKARAKEGEAAASDEQAVTDAGEDEPAANGDH
ncbi:hypothetical protein [Streptomyces sp. NPDC048385]|uniref:hypothetical protein n=1 Tax=unclassified Streptomyces TaxID=2593676 RepID=UPI00344855A7